ncbi:MAG TPA: hypothetical protein ENH33_07215, partial [Actinobacteria bacterium]|nr:hypothetical protein [Actinomycetota bacterium]
MPLLFRRSALGLTIEQRHTQRGKTMLRNTLLAVTIILFSVPVFAGGITPFQSAVISKTGSATPSACSSAAAGDICAGDDLTAGDDLSVGGDAAITGATTLTGALTQNGYSVTTPAVFDTFAEGASKGIFSLQSDGTAFDGTAGVLNIIHTSWGNTYAYFPIVGQTAEVVMGATGL